MLSLQISERAMQAHQEFLQEKERIMNEEGVLEKGDCQHVTLHSFVSFFFPSSKCQNHRQSGGNYPGFEEMALFLRTGKI